MGSTNGLSVSDISERNWPYADIRLFCTSKTQWWPKKLPEINALKMAHPDGETLNSVFEVLEDWEHQLKHENLDFEELGL